MELDKNYWLVLFNINTWSEFISYGKNTFGFNLGRKNSLSNIRKGDYLICYLSGLSRFIGIYEVTSELYQDEIKIWTSGKFPLRINAKPIYRLTPETSVQLYDLKNRLSFFKNLKTRTGWTYKFRSSPCIWNKEDGKIIMAELKNADEKKVVVPITDKKPIVFTQSDLMTS